MRRFAALGVGLWALASWSVARSEDSSAPPVLRLDGAAIDVSRPALDGTDSRGARPVRDPTLGSVPPVPGRRALWVVHLGGPTRDAWLEALRAAGLDILQYVPEHGYLVWGAPEAVAEGRRRAPILSSGLLPPVLKLAPDLRPSASRAASAVGPAGEEPLDLVVQLFDVGDPDRLPRRLARSGAKVLWRASFGRRIHLRVLAGAGLLRELARWPSVYRIERFPRHRLLGERDAVVSAGAFPADATCVVPGYADWLARKGLAGRGIAVHVMDDGIEQGISGGAPGTAHADVLGRIAGVDNATSEAAGDSIGGHGSINAGIIAGDAATGWRDAAGFLPGQGMAPEATLFGTKIFNRWGRFESSRSFSDLVAAASAAGCLVSSNSWGTDRFGEYDADAAEYDALARDAHPGAGEQPMTMVFAAGNAGESTFDGSMTLGTPASGKNVISVGALEGCDADGTDGCLVGPDGADSVRDVIRFSSRGPLRDGRLGPTLVAPGTHVSGIASTARGYDGTGVCDAFWPAGQALYARSSGTSHACPQVAGAAALFHEWYREATGSTASPALVKAALVTAARDLAGGQDGVGGTLPPLPGDVQGWGRLALEDLLPDAGEVPRGVFLDAPVVLDDSEDAWESTAFPLDPSGPVRICLAWTDPPAIPGADPVLVNDLDLVVESGGETYLGNVFLDGASAPGGERDARNNLECVYLRFPGPALTIRVVASNLAGDGVPSGDDTDQDFALVVLGGTDRSSKGVVRWRSAAYACDADAEVIVSDLDLAGTGSARVAVESSAAPGAVQLTLTEVGGSRGLFRGTVPLGSGAGRLLVSDGGSLIARYSDLDDGSGRPAEPTASAAIDCRPPGISDVRVERVDDTSALVAWTAGEDSAGTVRYGSACAGAALLARTPRRAGEHSVVLGGLQPGTRHFWSVTATDPVGNETRADAGGACYTFVTSSLLCRFADDLEPAPAAGWTHAAAAGPDDWGARTFAGAHSPTHAWRSAGLDGRKDAWLIAPPLEVSEGDRFSFWHHYELEHGYDGAVLEISVDGGASWVDLGGSALEGGYSGVLDEGNPLGERPAWTGAIGSSEMSRVLVDVSPWAGPGRLIRFRLACDDWGVDGVGWSIDDVSLCRLSNKRGGVRLDRAAYGCDATATVSLDDLDLVGAGSAEVRVSSTSAPEPRTVVLAEDPAVGGVFATEVSLGAAGLPVADGDEIRVEYLDADDGSGAGTSARTATARVDCEAPRISRARILEALDGEVTVAWETDEPAFAAADIGFVCNRPLATVETRLGGTSHVATFEGLMDSAYFFRVSAWDEAGNRTEGEAAGGCRIVSPLALELVEHGFDDGAPGWTHEAAEGDDRWALVETPIARSRPAAWFLPGTETVSDVSLVSPPFRIEPGSVLSFWHLFDFEMGYDGGVLELSLDAGTTWSDLGPWLRRGGYNAVLVEPNPIAGRRAWSGTSAGILTRVLVDLDEWAGETGRVRFRAVSDSSGSGDGWTIDDVAVLQPLREAATLVLDRSAYPCGGEARVTLLDAGRTSLGSATVELTSPGEAVPEVLVLPERLPDFGIFEGTIDLAPAGGAGVLVVRHGDTIRATYQDEQDGTGNPGEAAAEARIDCLPPRISGVAVDEIDESSATVRWDTDEATLGVVEHGTACGALGASAPEPAPAARHAVRLEGLAHGAEHRFRIVATDAAGNSSADDLGGACHAFRTRVLLRSFRDPVEPAPAEGWVAEGSWRALATPHAHSAPFAWRATEGTESADESLATPPVRIALGDRLEFWHVFELLEGGTGGVLEGSTDGGRTWVDLEPSIVEGSYTGFIVDGTDLEGRRAWTGGTLGPPRRVRVRLDAVAGPATLLRFRFVAYGLGFGEGGSWVVDDVSVSRPVGGTGVVEFAKATHACGSRGRVLLADADLTGRGSAAVAVLSPARGSRVDLAAAETGPGLFEAEFGLADEATAGLVTARHGDVLEAAYEDASTETGAPGTARSAAAVDCEPPRIRDVHVGEATFSAVDLVWRTDEPALGRARYGADCASLAGAAGGPGLRLLHEHRLRGIDVDEPFALRIEAEDAAGNRAEFPASDACSEASIAADCALRDAFDPATNAWAHGADIGSDEWRVVTFARSHSGTRSYHTPSPDAPKDSSLVSPALDIPPSAALSFWHTYELEEVVAGCVLEISEDGGATWIDLGDSIVEGAYDWVVVLPDEQDFRPAWTGGSIGPMTQVIASLAEHAGPGRKVRFRILSSGFWESDGWYIDDVAICSLSVAAAGPRFTRGNCNADASVNLSDAVFLLVHLFLGGSEPACRRACDTDDDDKVDLTDAIYLLRYLFLGGDPVAPPETCAELLDPSPVECGADSCAE